MQEQNNKDKSFKYFIDGKEVDNRTDYLNTTMSGDYVSYFDGDSVFSVSFSNFFAENKDNNKMIKREVNGHIIDILDLGQIKEDNFSELLKDPTYANKIYQDLKNELEDYEQIVTTTITVQTNTEQAEKIKEIVKEFNNQNSAEKEENLVFQKDSEIHKEEGVKESNGKTDYSEIDWDFIEGLAKRMNKNKDKYEPFNYHKPMDVNLLKQSLLRHVIEILKGEHNDAGQEYGHLFAVALNAQMIYYQLKNNS